LLVAVAYGIYAQSDARPAFQAASIKRNTGERSLGRIIRPLPGGSLRTENAPVVTLVQNAYGLQAFQVLGGPEWINTDGYDIEAKPDAPVERAQMWKMVQTLLADRFQLAVHRESRDVPGYALTVLKAAPKLPAPKDGSCGAEPTDLLPQPGSPPPCGRMVINMSPAGLRVLGGKIAMPELIRILSIVMGRPVVDRTGFTGEFDVSMTFTPDENTMGLPGAGGPRDAGGPRVATDPEKPNILAALQEQLGLKLSAAKVPVEVLVIDHVERPTAN